MESEIDVSFNTTKMRYEEKKITINVFMVSMSGKVASGSVSFSLFGKEPGSINECVQFLEKCPDKAAKIFYNFSFEVRERSARMEKSFHSNVNEPMKKSTYQPVSLNSKDLISKLGAR